MRLHVARRPLLALEEAHPPRPVERIPGRAELLAMQEIDLADDADELAIVEHGHGADTPGNEKLGDVEHRSLRGDPGHVAGHDVSCKHCGLHGRRQSRRERSWTLLA